MNSGTHKISFKLLFTFLLLTLFGCASENQAINLSELPDNSSSTGNGGVFFPNGSGSNDTCQRDETGICIDASESSQPIDLSTTALDFGLNELDGVECQILTIPNGASFEAEIDKTATSAVALEEQDEPSYQFVFKSSGGSYVADRFEGSGELSICYLRQAIGSHSGQIKLVLNASSTSSAYAYIIPVRGETMAKVFTITSPSDNQIIDSRSGHNEGVDSEEGDYLVTASGLISLELSSIYESGLSTPILIDSAGVKYQTTFDSSGNFSKQIGVPQTPGLYNILFSLNTNKNEPIEKTVPIVVADTPKIEIEIRDSAGFIIDTASPTDAPSLIVGIKITNLSYSGSSESEMPVTLSKMMFNGESLSPETNIWYDDTISWCRDTANDVEFTGFDGSITYCIPLADITELQNGQNTISATAANALGESTASVQLILDNGKPTFRVTSPEENSLYEPGITKILIKGTVKNFAPVDPSLLDNIPAPSNASDIGSYCQPKSSEDSSCPESSVKLWFNISTSEANLPIHIFPQVTIPEDQTLADYNSAISENPKTKSNCETKKTTETLFEGDKASTVQNADGSIVTTITAEDGSTTTYTTSSDGHVTLTTSSDDTVTVLDKIEEGDNISNTISNDTENGLLNSSTVNNNTDTTISTSTDVETGEITQITEQRVCNVPAADFEITFTFPSDSHHGKINLYSNILQLQADSVSGHNTIKVVTFQTGLTKETHAFSHDENSNTGTLTAGTLGTSEATCSLAEPECVDRAPLLLNVSSGLLDRTTTEGKKIITAIEYTLNDQLRFSDVINGWPHDTKPNGKTDLIKDYRDQYKAATGKTFKWVTELDRKWQKEFIWQGIHSSSMAKKIFALQSYKAYRMFENDPSVPPCELHNSEMCFMENIGDPFNKDSGFAVARDACDNEITTAFVPISDLKHIAEADTGVTNTLIYESEWPLIAGPDLDFNDFTEGVWHVDSVVLKENGWVDADICLVPADLEITSCDDDVSNAKTPALWGHFISYNLIKGGLLQGDGIDDETMPLVWSLGKLRLKLEHIIQLSPKTLKNGTWANTLDINLSPDLPKTVYVDVFDLEKNARDNSVILEPFGNCDGYYRDLYQQKRAEYAAQGFNLEPYNPEVHLPYGCNPNYDNGQANYPFLLDRTSTQGKNLYNLHHDRGDDNFLLATVWQGVTDTVKKIAGCLDTELINPMFNPDYYTYPGWVSEDDKISTSFEWEEFNFEAIIGTADLQITTSGLTVRLPLEIGVDSVQKPKNDNPNLANTKGHLVRTNNADALDKYPMTSRNPLHSAFAGISLNVEEIFNSASYLLLKKGPLSLLETFDVDELEINNNWSVGIDKVVLGRMDICDIAGLLSSDLAYDVLFASVASIFDYPSLHLDLILDKDYPPTLSMNPIEYTAPEGSDSTAVFKKNQASEIKISLNNVQIAVKELIPYENAPNVYYNPKSQEEVLRVRVDGVISLKAIYHADIRTINVFISDYAYQNLHLSVPPGHRGPTYNDTNVVNDLISSVVQNLFSNIAKEFDPDPSAAATLQIVLKGEESAISVVDLNELEFVFNTNLADNATCGDNIPLYIDEYENQTTASDNSEDEPEKPNYTFEPIEIKDPNDLLSNMTQIYPTVCNPDSGRPIMLEDNPIADVLCDFGIKDVLLTPTLKFDNDQGYLHLSSDIEVELLDSLTGD